MAVRIQLRRDTAANWISSNPVLRQGEMGIETDTLKIKLGDGTSTWTQISGYMNLVPDGNLTIGDYVMVNDIGAAEGVVGLDINKNAIVTGSSIILEGSTNNAYETTLTVTDPTADRTITFKNADGTVAFVTDIPSTTDALSEGSTNKYFTDERAQDAVANSLAAGTHTNITVTYNDAANSLSLAAAPGYVDEQAVDAVAAALAAGTHTNISVSYNDAGNAISLTGAQTYNDENAQDAIGNNLGTGLSYNDTTGAISVDTTAIQARVSGVSDTEIGYLDGVTSAIQTQIDAKLASSTASTTYAPIASPTFTGTVAGITKSMVGLGNVDNTTDANKPVSTATQTALDLKAPIASPTFTGTVTLPGAPTSDLHAATKAYVDASTSGLNVHASVKAATTSNINLNNQVEAGDVLDGVTLAHNDRILVKNQNDARDNGVYTVEPSGAPVRAADYNTAGEVDAGDFIFVESGTANSKTGWIQTNAITTLGTDAIAFTQFSGAGTYSANNGLTLTGNVFSINTGITADLTTAQTLTNKTLTSPVINTPTGITKSDVGLANVDNTTDAGKPISTATQTALDLKLASATAATTYAPIANPTFTGTVAGITKTMVGLGNVDNTTDAGKPISTATQTALDLKLASATAASTYAPIANPTFTGTVAGVTKSHVGLGNVDNTSDANKPVSTATQTALDLKVDESLFDAKGDLLVGSADNTPAKLPVGTNGYLLTANSSATNGVEWAAAPVSLPSQSGNSGKYLTTDGTSATWGTLVVPITTGTVTVNQNTAQYVDTTALSAFTSIEYMVSIKQGSKTRTSKVIVQTDGTSVDMTEFAITETGGTLAGVVVSATTASSNAKLQVTVTDALSTNATVKFSKVAL
jgi:hypothetical protein